MQDSIALAGEAMVDRSVVDLLSKRFPVEVVGPLLELSFTLLRMEYSVEPSQRKSCLGSPEERAHPFERIRSLLL